MAVTCICLPARIALPRALADTPIAWQSVDLQKLPSEWPTAIALSPDGTRLACSFDDGRIIVWDCEDGQLLCQTTVEADPSAVFFPDATTVCAGAAGGSVFAWNFAKKNRAEPVCRLGGPIQHLIAGKDRAHAIATVLCPQASGATKDEWAKHVQGMRFEAWSLRWGEKNVAEKIMGPIKGWLLRPAYCGALDTLAVVWYSFDEASQKVQVWLEFRAANGWSAIKRIGVSDALKGVVDTISYDPRKSRIIARTVGAIVEISVPEGRVVGTRPYGKDLGIGPFAIGAEYRRVAMANSMKDEVSVLTYPELSLVARIPEVRLASDIQFSLDGKRIAIVKPGVRLFAQKLAKKGRAHP
jgi:hypothetical protein